MESRQKALIYEYEKADASKLNDEKLDKYILRTDNFGKNEPGRKTDFHQKGNKKDNRP